jgi:hypothetical protein
LVGGQTTIHAGLIWCDPPDTTPHRSFPAEGKRKGNARTACKPGILDTAPAGRYHQKRPDFMHPVHAAHQGSGFCIGKQ